MSKHPQTALSSRERWLSWGAWFLAIIVLAVAVFLTWKTISTARAGEMETELTGKPDLPAVNLEASKTIALPRLLSQTTAAAISRGTELHTIIPNRPRQEIKQYTVETGDSVFALAKYFNIEPESVLWANYDLLNDNPDYLAPGMELVIPPVDGVLYTWKEGDTINGVAEAFEAKASDILGWPGNRFDLTNPKIEPGAQVMIPGGKREFRSWVVPTIPRGAAGVSSNLLGGGACEGGYEGAYGSGAFVWPADNHYLSGNDYWSGHLAIDIAAGLGAAVYASDSGVVVFAGAAYGGYGNMIMIDHGNGYQTLYAHLSSVNTSCGASVYQGQFMGLAGSTGRSTGPHLHFEVRYLGGFVSPWFVLPPP